MTFIAIGIVTVAIVFLVNKVILAPLSNLKVITLVPMFEEMAKTLLPLWVGSSVLLNHAFFGAFEALHDFWYSGRKSSLLALVGFLGHLFFGYMTLLGYKLLGNWIVGIALGYLLHMAWNYAVVEMAGRDLK